MLCFAKMLITNCNPTNVKFLADARSVGVTFTRNIAIARVIIITRTRTLVDKRTILLSAMVQNQRALVILAE